MFNYQAFLMKTCQTNPYLHLDLDARSTKSSDLLAWKRENEHAWHEIEQNAQLLIKAKLLTMEQYQQLQVRLTSSSGYHYNGPLIWKQLSQQYKQIQRSRVATARSSQTSVLNSQTSQSGSAVKNPGKVTPAVPSPSSKVTTQVVPTTSTSETKLMSNEATCEATQVLTSEAKPVPKKAIDEATKASTPVTKTVTNVATKRPVKQSQALLHDETATDPLLKDADVGPLKDFYCRNAQGQWVLTKPLRSFKSVRPEVPSEWLFLIKQQWRNNLYSQLSLLDRKNFMNLVSDRDVVVLLILHALAQNGMLYDEVCALGSAYFRSGQNHQRVLDFDAMITDPHGKQTYGSLYRLIFEMLFQDQRTKTTSLMDVTTQVQRDVHQLKQTIDHDQISLWGTLISVLTILLRELGVYPNHDLQVITDGTLSNEKLSALLNNDLTRRALNIVSQVAQENEQARKHNGYTKRK